jgi:hypothetical protein
MKLTDDQIIRFSLLCQALDEALLVVGKILCNNSICKEDKKKLEKELGRVRWAMLECCNAGDVEKLEIHIQAGLLNKI